MTSRGRCPGRSRSRTATAGGPFRRNTTTPPTEVTRLANIAAALIAMKGRRGQRAAGGSGAVPGARSARRDAAVHRKDAASGSSSTASNDRTLADVIVGAAVEGRPSYRYARLPGSNRTYVARVEGLDASTKLQDWIETSLLKVDRPEIDQILVRNYSVSPAKNSIDGMDVVPLRKRAEDGGRSKDRTALRQPIRSR